MTTSYNLCGNSICERFNHTLLGLLQSLLKEQKSCGPLHVPSLVFAYNAMPHSVTDYQPYELMFGQKAPAVCDAWLGLAHYNDQVSANKCAWLIEQHELLMSANRWALKHIKQSAKKSQIRTGGKSLQIPIGDPLTSEPSIKGPKFDPKVKKVNQPQICHPYGTRSKTKAISASVQSVVPDIHLEQRGHSGLGQWVRQFFGSVKEAAVQQLSSAETWCPDKILSTFLTGDHQSSFLRSTAHDFRN